jgi:hypothetical protein
MVPIQQVACALADRLFHQRRGINRALDGEGNCLRKSPADTTPTHTGESKLCSRQRYET